MGRKTRNNGRTDTCPKNLGRRSGAGFIHAVCFTPFEVCAARPGLSFRPPFTNRFSRARPGSGVARYFRKPSETHDIADWPGRILRQRENVVGHATTRTDSYGFEPYGVHDFIDPASRAHRVFWRHHVFSVVRSRLVVGRAIRFRRARCTQLVACTQ